MKHRFLPLYTCPTGLPDYVVQAGFSQAGFVVKEDFFNSHKGKG
jgi:hypothetical protein